MLKACEWCGMHFMLVHPNTFKIAKFCTEKCRDQNRKQRRREREAGRGTPVKPRETFTELKIEELKEKFPSLKRTWDVEMVENCRRPIMDMLADQFQKLHEQGYHEDQSKRWDDHGSR